MSSSFLSGLIIVSAIACSSPEEREYARIARVVNPILTAMQPAAARMLAANPDDHAEVIAACWSVDPQLMRLRDIGTGVHNHISLKLSTRAHLSLLAKPYVCKPGPDRVKPCSTSCMEDWQDMITDVERLRTAAKAAGVEIVSLDPSPTGSPR